VDLILLKRVLGELAVPPSVILLMFLLGWLLSRRWPRLGRGVSTLGVVSLWLLSTPMVANRLARSIEDYPPFDLKSHVDAQAVVILAGGTRPHALEYGEDAPRPATLQRIAYGTDVARATGLPVAVSGGSVRGDEPEALVMKRFLEREFRVPVTWAETASRDTHQNAVYSYRMLHPPGIQRIILVTSSSHMRRSVQEFRAAGFEVIPAPADFARRDESGLFALIPRMDALTRSQETLHELLGEFARGRLARD
jgi:uncharacterized SAM-binding protein YcdF (DUF218 family)